jgi:hypothetical protein
VSSAAGSTGSIQEHKRAKQKREGEGPSCEGSGVAVKHVVAQQSQTKSDPADALPILHSRDTQRNINAALLDAMMVAAE